MMGKTSGIQQQQQQQRRTMAMNNNNHSAAVAPLVASAPTLPAAASNAIVSLNKSTTTTTTKSRRRRKQNDIAECNFGPRDFLLGRGVSINSHVGNRHFRALVQARKADYRAAHRNSDKSRIAMQIVKEWRRQNGRFLRKHGNNGVWHDVGDQKSREITSQKLRENSHEEIINNNNNNNASVASMIAGTGSTSGVAVASAPTSAVASPASSTAGASVAARSLVARTTVAPAVASVTIPGTITAPSATTAAVAAVGATNGNAIAMSAPKPPAPSLPRPPLCTVKLPALVPFQKPQTVARPPPALVPATTEIPKTVVRQPTSSLPTVTTRDPTPAPLESVAPTHVITKSVHRFSFPGPNLRPPSVPGAHTAFSHPAPPTLDENSQMQFKKSGRKVSASAVTKVATPSTDTTERNQATTCRDSLAGQSLGEQRQQMVAFWSGNNNEGGMSRILPPAATAQFQQNRQDVDDDDDDDEHSALDMLSLSGCMDNCSIQSGEMIEALPSDERGSSFAGSAAAFLHHCWSENKTSRAEPPSLIDDQVAATFQEQQDRLQRQQSRNLERRRGADGALRPNDIPRAVLLDDGKQWANDSQSVASDNESMSMLSSFFHETHSVASLSDHDTHSLMADTPSQHMTEDDFMSLSRRTSMEHNALPSATILNDAMLEDDNNALWANVQIMEDGDSLERSHHNTNASGNNEHDNSNLGMPLTAVVTPIVTATAVRQYDAAGRSTLFNNDESLQQQNDGQRGLKFAHVTSDTVMNTTTTTTTTSAANTTSPFSTLPATDDFNMFSSTMTTTNQSTFDATSPSTIHTTWASMSETIFPNDIV